MRKAIPLIFFTFPLLLEAQGTWMQMSDLDGSVRQWAVGFTIDGRGYVTSGMSTDSLILTGTWEYDPTTNSWTSKADMPVGRMRGVGMSIGDKGYVGTGAIGDTLEATSDWWMFDPILDTWTQRANFPGQGRVDAIGFAVNGKCYVGGGLSFAGTTFNDFYEYDPDLDSWTALTDITDGPMSAAAVFVLFDQAYVVGGRTAISGVYSNDLYRYVPADDTWTLLAPFPGEARLDPVAFAIGDIGFVGTGDAGMLTTDWYAYEPATTLWHNVAEFPGAARTMAVAFAIGNHGYVTTGSTGVDLQTDDLWEFTPGTTSLSPIAGKNDLMIYPNPTTGPCRLMLPDNTIGTVHLSVHDVLGQLVWQKNFATTPELAVDFSSIPIGTYFVRVQDRNFDSMKVMVIER